MTTVMPTDEETPVLDDARGATRRAPRRPKVGESAPASSPPDTAGSPVAAAVAAADLTVETGATLAGRGPVDVEPPSEPPPPARTRFRGPGPSGGDETPPGVPQEGSSYLEYLPGIYHSNLFLSRFLLIFESILSPVNRTTENLHHYFDPQVTPPEFVDWLGSWLGLVLDERWPEQRRRDLIAAATNLYQWRGTKYGLSEFLRLYTGIEPEIIEPTLREVANNRSRAYRFTVRMRVPKDAGVSRALIESIIDAEKPAFAACTLELSEE